jgi:uncharacterized membrane protein
MGPSRVHLEDVIRTALALSWLSLSSFIALSSLLGIFLLSALGKPSFTTFIMVQLLQAASILVSAVPMPTPAPDLALVKKALHKRASCTFTAASAASKSKADCATIVLSGITVPSGVTLDLTDLTDGTAVSIFPAGYVVLGI